MREWGLGKDQVGGESCPGAGVERRVEWIQQVGVTQGIATHSGRWSGDIPVAKGKLGGERCGGRLVCLGRKVAAAKSAGEEREIDRRP